MAWAKRIYYDGSVFEAYQYARRQGEGDLFLQRRVEEYLVDDVEGGKISKLALKTERAFFQFIDWSDLSKAIIEYNPNRDD